MLTDIFECFRLESTGYGFVMLIKGCFNNSPSAVVRIVEFERNMAYQRTLFSEESLGPKSYLGALADQYAENAQLIESTLADCSATFLESFRAIDKSFRSLGRSYQRSAVLFSGIEANRRKNSLRYMKRSLNQLIKLLKRSASGS